MFFRAASARAKRGQETAKRNRANYTAVGPIYFCGLDLTSLGGRGSKANVVWLLECEGHCETQFVGVSELYEDSARDMPTMTMCRTRSLPLEAPGC